MEPIVEQIDRKLEIIKDRDNQQLIFKKSQDCSGILKENREERNAGVSTGHSFRKFASVPIDVLDHWITEGVDYRKIKDDPDMRMRFYAKLNSRDWCGFKTTNGSFS